MKTYLVFSKLGDVARIEATSMTATANSIRFFNGKELVAVFDFSEVRKVGEAKVFPEQDAAAKSLSVETINDWLTKLPTPRTSDSTN